MSNTLRISAGVLGVAAVLAAGGLFAADWPQWRGNDRDGLSAETGLLKEWPAAGPKLLWQVKDVGAGYSTPAVAGDRLYVMGNKGADDEYVQARNVADGAVVWTRHVGKVGSPQQQPSFPGSRSTPTVDGKMLYALGSAGDLVCLDAAKGDVLWAKNLVTDFGGQPGRWAYAESPLIDGEALVCTPGGEQATLVALNKKTGEVIWKSAVPGGDQAGYASAIVVEVGGLKQYVQFLAKGLVGVDAKTGKSLWRSDKVAGPAQIQTPVAGGGYVYVGAGRSGGGAVELKVNNGAVEVRQAYFQPALPTAIGGTVRVGDYLYGTGRELTCSQFKTGQVAWTNASIGAASLCCVDGRLYLHGENGQVALVEAASEAYREKGRFTPPDQPDRGSSKAWAYPVVANGKLYIRDLGCLWCYDIAAPVSKS